jgi:hypothetical protein
MATPIQEEIARQLHLTKPDRLVPKRDVGMQEVGTHALRILIFGERTAVVTYDEGMDEYNVTVKQTDGTHTYNGVGPDTMTELVWGEGVKDFEAACGPMVVVTDWFTADGEPGPPTVIPDDTREALRRILDGDA